MLRAVRIPIIALAVLWAALPTTAPADDHFPAVAEMWTMVPKADQHSEFFEGLKAHMAFRSEAGDPWAWKTYTPMLGDAIDTVAVRYCCFDWADFDAYRNWNEEHPEIDEHWREHVAPYVERYGHYFDTISWENTNIKKEWGPYRYYVETKFYLKPGEASTFDAARDKISQIALNQGWATEEHPWIWLSEVGGPPAESIIMPMKDMAGMARDGENFFEFMAGKLGSDEAAEALFASLAGAVEQQERQIWELHPDLSLNEPE